LIWLASLATNLPFARFPSPTGAWSGGGGTSFIFPYAVLELKIASAALDKSSEVVRSWIEELTREGGVVEATKFSKFLTGYAGLYEDKVGVVPSWMGQPRISAAVRGEEGGWGGGGGGPAPMAANKPLVDRVNQKPEKKRVPDQKSIMANERTLLAWVRTTMLVLYGSSFFLDHDLPGPTNLIVGWGGVTCSLVIIVYSHTQYRKRNQMLVAAEADLNKYVDNIGTNLFLVATLACSIAGFAAYRKSVLTYNNWAIYNEGDAGAF
jgi:hypothetical protein